MDTSRRGLHLLWYYIKYYFLINFFQDVTEGVSNSKKYLKFRLVLFNLRQTMRILPLARALRFSRVFQKIQPVNASAHSDYIRLVLQKQLKKYGSIIIQLQKPFQRLLSVITYVVAGLVTRDPDGELSRYRGSTLSATHAYWSLHGVIDISVEPPICYILFSFHWLMRYSAWHRLRCQDNSQWRHLLWSFFSHMDYAARIP